jgi:hypothetical protein
MISFYIDALVNNPIHLAKNIVIVDKAARKELVQNQ